MLWIDTLFLSVLFSNSSTTKILNNWGREDILAQSMTCLLLLLQGLVVPVLRNVQDMNYADIEKGIAALGDKAKKNQLSVEVF